MGNFIWNLSNVRYECRICSSIRTRIEFNGLHTIWLYEYYSPFHLTLVWTIRGSQSTGWKYINKYAKSIINDPHKITINIKRKCSSYFCEFIIYKIISSAMIDSGIGDDRLNNSMQNTAVNLLIVIMIQHRMRKTATARKRHDNTAPKAAIKSSHLTFLFSTLSINVRMTWKCK